MILSLLQKYLAPFKMYLYIALASAMVIYHFSYGHSKYMQGKQDCINKQAETQRKYAEQQRTEDNKKAQETIKQTEKLTSQIQTLRSEKQNAITKIQELPKATDGCTNKLSSDELREFNSAINKANGQ